MRRYLVLLCGATLFAVLPAVAQSSDQRDTSNQPPPRSDRSPSESSSKDTMIDLSPPMGDAKSHPNGGIADDVLEMHPYDPHRAEKDVEIGDFYFKKYNYKAAESRYREALDFKPNDAVATYKVAVSLDKQENAAEAQKFYEKYLEILPHGPYEEDCKSAIDRLKKAAAMQAKVEEPKKEKKKK